jgi:hypothetical protein
MSSLLDKAYELIEDENTLIFEGKKYNRVQNRDCHECDLMEKKCWDIICHVGGVSYVFKKVEG